MQRVRVQGLIVGAAAVLVVGGIVGAVGIEASGEEAPAKGVAALGWLAGDWTMEAEGSTWDEHWLAPRGDAVLAVSRMVSSKDGTTRLCELTAIEQTADGPVLRLRHFSRSLEPWKSEAEGPITMKLAEQGERKVVFEAPEREFPKRLTYEREGDVLVAKLEGEHDGKPAGNTFRFRRGDAPR